LANLDIRSEDISQRRSTSRASQRWTGPFLQEGISWGIQGLTKVLIGPPMADHCTHRGRPPLNQPDGRFRGGRPEGRWSVAVFRATLIPLAIRAYLTPISRRPCPSSFRQASGNKHPLLSAVRRHEPIRQDCPLMRVPLQERDKLFEPFPRSCPCGWTRKRMLQRVSVKFELKKEWIYVTFFLRQNYLLVTP
jgi:hypothetical protein